jgi:hypothetical protein
MSPCEIGTNVIMCSRPRGIYRRGPEGYCFECRKPHRFVTMWDGAWYGTTLYGECGDTWQDGFRMERPFRRAWRQAAVKWFERMWENALPAELYNRYVEADMAQYSLSVGEATADAEIEAALAAIRAFRPERGDA